MHRVGNKIQRKCEIFKFKKIKCHPFLPSKSNNCLTNPILVFISSDTLWVSTKNPLDLCKHRYLLQVTEFLKKLLQQITLVYISVDSRLYTGGFISNYLHGMYMNFWLKCSCLGELNSHQDQGTTTGDKSCFVVWSLTLLW